MTIPDDGANLPMIEHFRGFLDAAPDAMIVVDDQGRIVAANDQMLRLFGYDRDEVIGHLVEVLLPARFRPFHAAHRSSYLGDPHTRAMGEGLELAGLRRDGSEFSVEVSLSPLDTPAGRMTIAGIRDSSVRRKNDRKFRGLLEAAPDAIIVSDTDGRIRVVNGQAERLFGYTRDELLGQPIEMLVPERVAGRHARHRHEYARNPHLRPMGEGLHLRARRKDGSEFPVEISLSPLETEDGVLFTSAVRDVTERRRLEEDVRRQNQILELQNRRVQEASRMKSEFLANMSHELRTPLNSIIGFAEMMHDGTLGPMADDHREYLGDILTSARHLLHLINDVLDLSKVESGTLEFFPEPVELAELVGEVRDMLHPLSVQKHIRLQTEIDPAIGAVLADPAKLKQVLANYLSNALKFTPDHGRVTIRAIAEEGERFRIEVEDTGVGVRDSDLNRLFIEFQQLDAGSAKKHQGTGLGLALTKRLVEAQGGRVGVQSIFGEGSRFYAVLPRIAAQAPIAVPEPPSMTSAGGHPRADGAGPATVLVLDDDRAALRLLQTALRHRGYESVCTNDPDLALAAAADEPPDVVVVDLLMPALPGGPFLEKLRARTQDRPIPAIVWTVKDLSPTERAHLLTVAQMIVQKRDGGISALLDAIALFVPGTTQDSAS